ncbi:hypothetical protein Pan216_57030 [Planctomycetes bacterium Pan216]|uniref:MOSC domain-containing protein n=1 Tax=Kolteria novifilia TaxID=2527975 RepID=A0A518BCU3_9BACT|nr:hypothetical protein Pan216_57030 [Planctomycetes bacterium Pan216]
MPRLAGITIFPFKSLAGVRVERRPLRSQGALSGDRTYALVDADGRYINGKRTAAVHLLRSTFSDDLRTIHLRTGETSRTFDLETERAELQSWCSDFFAQPLTLRVSPDGGFPDDTESPGPTLISTATLKAVARWFPGLPVDEVRRRFRANLEIDADEPFWEDRLLSRGEEPCRFSIGGVTLLGTTCSKRCVVPSRDSHTGEPWPGFQKEFLQRRQASLPAWAPPERFDHTYRLAVNTKVPESEWDKTLTVGDRLELL